MLNAFHTTSLTPHNILTVRICYHQHFIVQINREEPKRFVQGHCGELTKVYCWPHISVCSLIWSNIYLSMWLPRIKTVFLSLLIARELCDQVLANEIQAECRIQHPVSYGKGSTLPPPSSILLLGILLGQPQLHIEQQGWDHLPDDGRMW